MKSISIVILILLFGVVAVVLIKYYGLSPTWDGDRSSILTTEAWHCFTKESCTLGGRDLEGNLVDAAGAVIENGVGTADEMEQHPLTYPAGHKYHKLNSWGHFHKWHSDWDSFCRRTAVPLSSIHYDNFDLSSGTKLLVLTGGSAPFYIDKPIKVRGIHIRRSARLYLTLSKLKEPLITTDFIVVETGGLLQAGSTFYSGNKMRIPYRPLQPLRIRLTHRKACGPWGEVAGETSYKFLGPGMRPSKLKDDGTQCFVGSSACISNGNGPKGIFVLFNGNVHLAGAIPEKERYHLWDAIEIKDNAETRFNDESWLAGLQTGPGKCLNSYAVPDSYSKVFGRVSSSAVAGSDSIEMDDSQEVALRGWVPDSLVLVTTTFRFSYSKGGGLDTPFTMNIRMPESVHGEAWAVSSQEGRWDKDQKEGLEVMRLKSTAKGTEAATTKLLFTSALKWEHKSGYVFLKDAAGRKIKVACHSHCALLTRAIVIDAELTDSQDEEAVCNTTIAYQASGQLGKRKGGGGELMGNHAGRANQPFLSETIFKQPLATFLSKSGRSSGAMEDDLDSYLTGGGGGLLCDSDLKSGNPDLDHPTSHEAAYFPTREQHCKKPCALKARGSYLYGNEDQTGCGAIFGAQYKVRYAASSCLDGVELNRMGTPGNFGTVGQYSYHLHLAGFVKSFTGYLRDKTYTREVAIRNSSNWCSFARSNAMHGTNESETVNNVYFLCYGHGIFIEDGVERNNVIDHCLSAAVMYTLPPTEEAARNRHNPSGIVGNASSDAWVPSHVWLTNRCNFIFRNVFCSSPKNCLAIWGAPWDNFWKAGPGNICAGDASLGLPGLSRKGAILNYAKEKITDLFLGNLDPQNKDLILDDGDASDMERMQAYKCISENIIYAINGFISENPDAPSTSGVSGAVGGGFDGDPSLFYLPSNAENSLLNVNFGVGQSGYHNTGYQNSGVYQGNAAPMLQRHPAGLPRLFCQNLMFNIGGSTSNGQGRISWINVSATLYFGCCTIGSECQGLVYGNDGGLNAQEHCYCPHINASFVDHITNASVFTGQIYSNPAFAWYLGSKAFIDEFACLFGSRIPPKEWGTRWLPFLSQDQGMYDDKAFPCKGGGPWNEYSTTGNGCNPNSTFDCGVFSLVVGMGFPHRFVGTDLPVVFSGNMPSYGKRSPVILDVDEGVQFDLNNKAYLSWPSFPADRALKEGKIAFNMYENDPASPAGTSAKGQASPASFPICVPDGKGGLRLGVNRDAGGQDDEFILASQFLNCRAPSVQRLMLDLATAASLTLGYADQKHKLCNDEVWEQTCISNIRHFRR